MSKHIREIREHPGDPIGGGSGEKTHFTVEYLGKRNNAEFPYTVANEVVATQIGISLGLSVPTVITHDIGTEPIALIQMLDRDATIQGQPPAAAKALEAFVSEHPDEVHGAIVFDLFIANNDRAFGPLRRNVAIDGHGQLQLYDHGNSCFYRPRPDVGIQAGIPRLDAVEKDIAAIFDKGRENHYLEFLTDISLVKKWCGRIKQLPEFLIEAAVDRIPRSTVLPNNGERTRLAEFLKTRRLYLYDRIVESRGLFPGLAKG
ncbi:MAG: hypothetical protein HOP29_08260 [Phycisphaerales bacterium]|nr:hypothetical protein [Phycisphaerales bacterium]